MEYSIHDARRAGFNKIVFIIKRNIEEVFRGLIESCIGGDVEICYACQEYDTFLCGSMPPEGRVKPYGKAHAVLAAKDIIKEPFVVISADDFYGGDAYAAASTCLDLLAGSERKAAVVAYRLRNKVSENGHVTHGLCEINADGCLARVIETNKIMPFNDGTIRSIDGCEEGRVLDPEAAISMNFWCFTPAMFNQLEQELTTFLQAEDYAHSLTAEYTLPEVADCLLQRNELSG